MKLLKILYFAHAWHLAKYQEPLVGQPFEAWKHGPVNRAVYDQIKVYKNQKITGRLKVIDVFSGEFVDAKCVLDSEKSTFLENIYSYYYSFHPYKLSDLTHEPGSPWDTVWRAAEERSVPGMLIPDALILEWFVKARRTMYVRGNKERTDDSLDCTPIGRGYSS
ncbi:Panacea domain-containing protein [Afifella marina]|nr:type II toxin-antitoxin system antitoxin SocA domain-containing protein [Afifella marina]